MASPEVSAPIVRALIDEARGKNYPGGVLGIRTQPAWSGPDSFLHEGVPVTVVPCVSALAVHEALLRRSSREWLVILTDRPEEDLGASVLTHLLWHRLRTPDPWEAVRRRFAATGIDPALTAGARHRDLATGLLAATPSKGTPPAPAGVLTRDHAFAAVAARHLGVPGPDLDGEAVLAWTADPAATTSVADLRAVAGDAVTDALLEWMAQAAGPAQGPLLALLRAGQAGDAVPLGLVVGVLVAARAATAVTAGQAPRVAGQQQTAREALIRLEPRLGGSVPAEPALLSWAADASRVVVERLGNETTRPQAERLLARADELLAGGQASTLAGISDVLPSGLTRRLADLATALRAATTEHGPATGQAPAGQAPAGLPQPGLPLPGAIAGVEAAWVLVERHRLAEGDRRVGAFRAAVRLTRWLAVPEAAAPAPAPAAPALAALVRRHGDVDGWVDSAVNDAVRGVGDAELGAGLAAVLASVRLRRGAHDTAFASALVAHTMDDPALTDGAHAGVWHLEDVLPRVVLPLATTAPTLLLVLDGMSAGVGTEVVGDILTRVTDGWAEALLPGQPRRAVALAALPTLTEVSRTSLLCGELRTGGQDAEVRGYTGLTRARGLAGALLFHKKPLDSSRPGFAVADDVGAAIDDTTGRPLVTCILNTIDDALDRSDPGGTDWSADTVRHLLPLLDRARLAGRVVVITADHGHVVERREGAQRPFAGISSGRSRPGDQPAGNGEVLVEGRRVLDHGGRAVLAVDERLRYGPLKAGYHGGAAPAEAVVPVVVLVPGAVPDGADLRLAPPQEPPWWDAPLPDVGSGDQASATLPAPATGPSRRTARPPRRPPAVQDPGLFEVEAPPPVPKPAPIAGRGSLFAGLADDVLGSPVFAAQRKIAGRVSTSDDQVHALLTALLGAPGQRLSPAQAATALAVPTVAVRGAVLHVQRLLNVESYPVLRVDADGVTVVLDEQLLREQFEVGP